MFLVGVELDSGHLRERGRSALVVSTASIIVPFALGIVLARGLYDAYSTPAVSFTAFTLFLGVALSITAFPVLARILGERGLQRTPMGVLALTSAAINDVTAWCLLALVVGVVRATLDSAAWIVGMTALYVGVMFFVVAPAVRRLLARRADAGGGRNAIAISLIGLLMSALVTEAIGIHAIFGAFLAGVVIPADSRLAKQLTTRLEDITVIVFLPVFFAFTGLRTAVGQLDNGSQWLVCAGIIALASAGKIGGTMLGGWLAGLSRRDGLTLGVLMNTRGLMELIVLNVALDLGIISPTLFTMMVVMAVVTTFMTSPLLDMTGRTAVPERMSR
jgi:Kef-type K+ transport system membrane component KefB